MKKPVTFICAIVVLLSLAAVAYGANHTQSPPADAEWAEAPQMEQDRAGGPRENGQKHSGYRVQIDFDAMVSEGVISQETCDKIKAYMEARKPSDLSGRDGQPPEMGGRAPGGTGQPAQADGQTSQTDGQAPDGNSGTPQTDSQAPDKNSQTADGNSETSQADTQAPDGNGQSSPADGQAPGGAPAGLPASPAGRGAAPAGGLLDDLLKDGVITQAEYDALYAAASR